MLHTLIEHAKDQPVGPSRPRPAAKQARPLPAPVSPPPAQDQHLRDMLRVLYRRRRMILTVAFLGAFLAAAVGLAISPRYMAIAEIAVEPPPRGSAGGQAQAAEEVIVIDTHIAMLSSRDQMTRVLDSLSPGAGMGTGEPSTGGGVADPISRLAGGLSLQELTGRLKMWSGLRAGNGTAMTLEQLERSAKIMQARRSRLISIAFTAKSPELAAAMANRIAELYVERQDTQKRASMSEDLARVGERIAELRSEALSTRSAAQILTALERRQDELRSALEFASADVRIASVAKPPERPSSSNPLLFILPASLICAIGASAFAVFRDRLDHSLRSERDVGDALGLPCIGLVPRTARMSATRRHRYLRTEPFSAYAESIRSAAATLKIVARPRRAKVVLVSSSVPMEGKSTLALSLAIYASGLGRRVLLVNLDFRKQSLLASMFSGRGLHRLNVQDLPPAQAIQQVPELGLDYLPVRRHHIDPLLFASEQMPQLLRQVRGSYDCVIIDGPPLLGAAEARLLPAVADKLLFVVKWGDTSREVAQSALRLLREAGSPGKASSEPATAILTQVDIREHARYRFGDTGELTLKYRRYYARARRAWRAAAASPPPAAPAMPAPSAAPIAEPPAASALPGNRPSRSASDTPAAIAAE